MAVASIILSPAIQHDVVAARMPHEELLHNRRTCMREVAPGMASTVGGDRTFDRRRLALESLLPSPPLPELRRALRRLLRRAAASICLIVVSGVLSAARARRRLGGTLIWAFVTTQHAAVAASDRDTV